LDVVAHRLHLLYDAVYNYNAVTNGDSCEHELSLPLLQKLLVGIRWNSLLNMGL